MACTCLWSSWTLSLHGGAANTQFAGLICRAVLLKDGEYLPEVLVVLLQCAAGDGEVIQVAEHEGQVFE